ncbi:hypothetical protein [Mycolicibacterium neworleansense]|uniref:Uncharacterized protein n=1 Tax=Mycolicibacterium neworleansense TaxID=146018 RepID=A0A0H5RL27_9MYCO|nr:hypothetical protein [Mycolicibacterium neworleansense]MCV7363849.1 hypothetical protein [Mycolicibacterium neworleansense]CRZ14810.1 hypothetical protein BN2156_01666 [Mycolicibacterium neworleansense]
MTSHAEAIAGRLPTLYRDGELVTGLAEVSGLQLDIVDEVARIIQRAHWFDTTVELSEAAALGALLDIPPQPWQGLGEYRGWLHALRTARLEHGAVSVPALMAFTRHYVDEFERVNDIEVLPPFETWATEFTRSGHAFIENQPQLRTVRLGGPGAVEPLTRQVCHGGLDPAALSVLCVGGEHSEYVPVLVNATTGEGLAYLGELRLGDRLWLRARPDGSITAQLNRSDVTAKLHGIRQVVPGTTWTPADVGEPRALTLRPGPNDLWFLPVAHFDAPGLDRALLALAGLDLTEGRWDTSQFDHALFYLDPAAYLDLSWFERRPATIRVDLDATALVSDAGRLDDALLAREQLCGSVGTGIRELAAAGVDAEVRFRPLHDSQRQLDHLTCISGMAQHEIGTVGVDRLTDSGGLFGVTAYDDSTYE